MKIQKNNLVIVTIIVVLIAAYVGIDLKQNNLNDNVVQTSIVEEAAVDDQHKIMKAYKQQISNIQVQSKGEVKAILADDNDGSRHQKMILKLENGLTVLVAHNIDLAPRVEGLRKGEIVEFYGEYEYSPKGGVIHWTHHDPQGKHVDGWLKYQGKSYQ
ncbi:DUF3465 domain-containing protein [Acinetobacter junii]|jgi:hypothetical protein|uniref:DUF3465 domain-containing protein n=1 Tax=Acinetobacter junii TaxID=40215 RepID=A0ABU8ZMV5_ACIJU|nr:DUF3465 domain-containing protein [Acinetobacter junii]MBY3627157.1 DUF3465 domain-containing protein [Acinetobacter sp. CUI P1]ENV65366.1 hypothetical protein F948_03062 [Acinetobacter junii CIP 64.5]MCE6005637.1 DUF3465 domain-containing protein [Acinetobacter junii]MDH1377369.1 DUF3465 domain-containing protein [Acinetobacter junii]MDH1858040.1 DUF3465 domain-containing protein [Acinetobacter junii]